MSDFTAIDFELASSEKNSVCSVGIVKVKNGVVVDEFYSLIRPPKNRYMWQTTRVHGISPKDTKGAPNFNQVIDKIRPLLTGQRMVAHNADFDRSVLFEIFRYYNLPLAGIETRNWHCTVKLYKEMGFHKTRLNRLCEIMNVSLNHHDALSDAKACASLFLKKKEAKRMVSRLVEEK